jgi:glycogen phosphorylase
MYTRYAQPTRSNFMSQVHHHPPSSTYAGSDTRTGMSPQEFKRAFLDHLFYTCARKLSDATEADLYRALSFAVRDRLIQRWLATQTTYFQEDVKRVCYLSSEFLVGRSLGLCLVNLGLYRVTQELLAERGYDLGEVLEREGDPGLGNGGLGRLAACFMDSLATLELPAIGYGIRYDFGIFEQLIENGWQSERRDNWLRYGNPWEIPQHDQTQVVRFGGHVEPRRDPSGRYAVKWVADHEVIGLPFDSFIVGHKVNNVNTLRLWSARATRDFNLALFNEGDYLRAVEDQANSESISKVLYPNDKSEKGKLLRLRQQYFFVACSLADILRQHKLKYPIDALPDKAAVQLNDTHPSIAVAELMRLLIDEEGLDWERAWAITESTLAYTNHTLLPEALEKWPVAMFAQLLPRHLEIIFEINRRFLKLVHIHSGGDTARVRRMSLIEEGHVQQIRMAHLAAVGSFSINGVAELHTQLIQRELLKDFHDLWPEKFNNKTNGVSQRRWLVGANWRLSQLITSRIGGAWADHAFHEIAGLRQFAQDPDFLDALWNVKRNNKRTLAALIEGSCHVEVDPTSMFVVQAKRFHEYKRQLLAILHVIALYAQLRQNPGMRITPRTFIFAGKAAPGYQAAKLHIKLINDVADIINHDASVADRLRVVFIPNYGVTLAETIIPAADLSVQISTAGREASGTSNMKFAMNGALTIGTLDGANIEIRDEVGPDNFFLFGLNVAEVQKLWRDGYDPVTYIEQSPLLQMALELLASGYFNPSEPRLYEPVLQSLCTHDSYMVCADFDAYFAAQELAAAAYQNRRGWSQKALMNIAGSARFSSDETIRAYANEIWRVRPTPVDADRHLELPDGTLSRLRSV